MACGVTRRDFMRGAAAVAATGLIPVQNGWCLLGAKRVKVTVGAHPWVYAAKLPNNDITPVLDQIFADMKYAGMDAIELMHTVLRPDDAVQRIGV